MRKLAIPKWTLAMAVVLACAASPAPAQDAAQPSVPSRYSFNRVDDGFLRLDTISGQVAFCSPHSVGWACVVVPEDRAALEKEIARLQDEVAQLKRQVASLHEPPPPRPPVDLTPREKSDNPGDNTAQLHENLARARVAIQHAWQRLVELIVTLQKDMMRKG
jgi:hypothetical protein